MKGGDDGGGEVYHLSATFLKLCLNQFCTVPREENALGGAFKLTFLKSKLEIDMSIY